MNELSLFSGAGGGLLASQILGHRVIGYVEFNEYCQKVIRARIDDGHLPEAPIFGDIRSFVSEGYTDSYQGMVDVVSGGFPCQPFSVAGKREAENDERNMWPAVVDVLRAIRPRYAFLENVPGLLTERYIHRIFGDLAEMGFDAKWCVLGADDVGAPHRRKRLWIKAELADTGSERLQGAERSRGAGAEGESNGHPAECSEVADTTGGIQPSSIDGGESQGSCQTSSQRAGRTRGESGSKHLEESQRSGSPRSWWAIDPCHTTKEGNREVDRAFDGSRWGAESPVGRVANGVADRVGQLKSLGNGQVPSVAAAAWRILSQ